MFFLLGGCRFKFEHVGTFGFSKTKTSWNVLTNELSFVANQFNENRRQKFSNLKF